jgi:hypothetical protein
MLALLLLTAALLAHPGSGIGFDATGHLVFVDTGSGIWRVEDDGQLKKLPGPAYHWFAIDQRHSFLGLSFTVPDGEIRANGSDPALILSSDYVLTIGQDGALYYPLPSGTEDVVLMRRAPSGQVERFAQLPRWKKNWINGLAAGPRNSLYYTEDQAIRKVDSRGYVSTIAERIRVANCSTPPSDEPITLPYLRGLAVAPDGAVFVAATGCGAVLHIRHKQVVSILRTERPWSPTAVAWRSGDVYALEYLHTATDNRREWLPRVRKLAPNGSVSTVAEIKTR